MRAVGQQLAQFRLVEKIGAGGMGVVYRAHDERLDRQVAIKVLPAEQLGDSASRARLLREARTASQLNHPNICTIHEVGEADGQAFIAMELVEGRPLNALVAEDAIPGSDVLRYGLQLADALSHAHQRKVVHRDFKSANVVVTPEGRAKVLDFGLARRIAGALSSSTTLTQDTLLEPGQIAGTLAYMAPEQLRGLPADERSDIWALGVVLYEMAAGVRPFKGDTAFDLSSSILHDAPPPLPARRTGAVPPLLLPIIERCLEKDPARRYQGAGQVRVALESIQAVARIPLWAAVKQAVKRHPAWTSVILLAVAAMMVALRVGSGGRQAGGPPPPARAIAVLPVANLSGDPEQEYFTDGITDALITDLSRISSLNVISRASMMRYKNVEKPLKEIARELNVDAVLSASAIREGSRVRVSAQLVDAATERNLWAQSFEREFSSILGLQAEVARECARTIQVKLTPEEEARLGSARTINPATYEAYLKGMFLLNRATEQDTEKGLAYLHRAVENDPADPLAYAGLALGYVEIGHSPEARGDSMIRAKAAAATALKLDDSLAEVQAAMGFVKGYWEWKWDEASDHIERALRANPSLAIAYYHRSWFRALFGRLEGAIDDHKRAKELDPFNPLHVAWLGELYRMDGRLEEAEAEARKSIEMAPGFPPGHFVLALVSRDRSLHDQAIASAQNAARVSGNWLGALGFIYAEAGRTDEARKVLAELHRQPERPMRSLWKAYIYGSLGDWDEALRWLQYEPHHVWVAWVGVQGWIRPPASDPRYIDLYRRMNVLSAVQPSSESP